MIDHSPLAKLINYKLNKLVDDLIIHNSLKLLTNIQLHLVEHDLWVRNKDIVIYSNPKTISFILVSNNSLIITVDKNTLIYHINGIKVLDVLLCDVLNWFYESN